MFWNKKKRTNKTPYGVELDIEINMTTLSKVFDKQTPPGITNIVDAWYEENCTTVSLGIAILKTTENVLIVSGSDGNIYKDMQFDIKLPYKIARNSTNVIKVTSYNNFVFFSFEDIVIMAIPNKIIIDMLYGNPLAKFKDAIKEFKGYEKDIEIDSDINDYSIAIKTKLGKDWFKYENTAVKVIAFPLDSGIEFPLNLTIG